MCGVDEETGDIFLKFEACEVSETSKFTWSKSYKEVTESNRVAITSSGRQYVGLDIMDLVIHSYKHSISIATYILK